jgi:hypothetical protein
LEHKKSDEGGFDFQSLPNSAIEQSIDPTVEYPGKRASVAVKLQKDFFNEEW